MKHEFKVTKSKEQTVYTIEAATGSSSSSGDVATVDTTLGGMQRRNPPGDNILAQEKKETPKPRNFVAKNAKMGGAGQHKDKKKAEKQGDVKHKKPLAESSYAEDLAKQVFNANPNIKDENAVLDAAWPIAVKDLGNKRAMSVFNYDEDFPSDLVSVYGWLQKDQQGVAEGVAETMPMDDAKNVLTHYGADYFKTTHDTLYFSKYRKQFSIGRIRDDDSASAGSVNLSDLNAIVRKLRGMRVPLSPFGEGVAEDHEIQMASSELESIAKNAVRLLALVRKYSEQQGLDAWQQSKITKAADYLNSVLQAVSGEQTSLEGVGMPFRGVGGAFNRGDDERHDLDMPEQDPREFRKYNLTINGKPLNPQPITGRSNLIKWGREHAASGVDLSNAVISLVDEDAYMESLTNMLERSVSQAQHNLMVGVANNPQFAQKVKVKQNVGQEFANADQGHDISKLPIRVPKKK